MQRSRRVLLEKNKRPIYNGVFLVFRMREKQQLAAQKKAGESGGSSNDAAGGAGASASAQ